MKIMFDEVRNNKLKSLILVSFFILLIGVLGAVIGLVYNSLFLGLVMAVIFSMIYSLIGYYSGNSMILAMSGARPGTKKEYPYLYHTIEGLAISAGIPTPKAY